MEPCQTFGPDPPTINCIGLTKPFDPSLNRPVGTHLRRGSFFTERFSIGILADENPIIAARLDRSAHPTYFLILSRLLLITSMTNMRAMNAIPR